MGATDFKTNLLKIKEQKPDVIEIKGGIKEVAQIIKQMQELEMKLPIIGSNMFMEPKLWELVGEPLKGVAYPTWAPAGPAKARYDRFMADYAKKYGFDIKTVTPIFTYEATKLAAYALEKGGNSGPEAQKALVSMKDFPGITGEITFVKGERKAQYCVEKIMGPGVYETTTFCTLL
jgi:branched-chain amino acid transport system substrate-binding protein